MTTVPQFVPDDVDDSLDTLLQSAALIESRVQSLELEIQSLDREVVSLEHDLDRAHDRHERDRDLVQALWKSHRLRSHATTSHLFKEALAAMTKMERVSF